MQDCLKKQIGRNVQVYVDDIVITTREERTLLDDLRETFAKPYFETFMQVPVGITPAVDHS